MDIVRFLVIDHHCDPACCGQTPLYYVCKSGDLDFVKHLVDKCHYEPNMHDKDGNTPLHCACERGHTDIIRFLIVDCHCDPACLGGGETPLKIACKRGKLNIVKFLVEECHCDRFGRKDKLDHTPFPFSKK